MIKYLYIVFIGILLTVLIGVGIAAFYPKPEAPVYPIELSVPSPEKGDGTQSAETRDRQIAFEKKSRDFQKANEQYSRNVSVIALSGAVLFVILGLFLAKRIDIFPDGLLLGSIGTLVYSIIRGFGAHDDIFRFIVVAVSLVIAILIGYIKFLKPKKHTASK